MKFSGKVSNMDSDPWFSGWHTGVSEMYRAANHRCVVLLH